MSARYLDANAAAPLVPEVRNRLRNFLETANFANPSSVHAEGRRARALVADAQEDVARSLGNRTDPNRIYFTSSGTESNQWAIRSILEPLLDSGEPVHWITTSIEHDSILSLCDWVRSRGGQVDLIPCSPGGVIETHSIHKLINPNTRLISCAWVNAETGVIQPIRKIYQLARERGVTTHFDAAQAWGKLPIDTAEFSDSCILTASGHKIGAPSGIGILWVSLKLKLHPLLWGSQQRGLRGGTENALAALALGEAARQLDPQQFSHKTSELQVILEESLSKIPGIEVNGKESPRVSNTTNFTVLGLEGEGLVMALDLEGFCVSAGSACASGTLKPSHVLLAMGRTQQEALHSIRVSTSCLNSTWEIEQFVLALKNVLERFKKCLN